MLTCATCPASAQVYAVDASGIGFPKADSIAARYQGHSLREMNVLARKLTDSLHSDVEKFRAIYKWVCDNVAIDYEQYMKTRTQRRKISDQNQLSKWNAEYGRKTLNNLLNKQKTLCSGYTWLIRQMCAYAGIEAVVIDGYGRGNTTNIGGVGFANHSWNAVRLNNQWHLCDATWSAGTYDRTQREFVKKYDDTWFLAAPEQFINKHYPLDTTWTLLKRTPSLSSFLNAPVTYNATVNNVISDMQPETLNATVRKSHPIAFSFHSSQPLHQVTLEVNGSSTPVDPDVRPLNSGHQYKLVYQFSRKGSYMVHARVEQEIVASWEVRVE